MRCRKPMQVEELEFQIAPMVDVLLCLLVFFIMITSASVLRSDRTLKLPVAANSTKKESARSEAIINVRWSDETKKGTATLGATRYDNLDLMLPELAPRYEANHAYRAVIRADRACPAQYVEKVMAVCAQAGIQDISFSVMNRE